MTMNPFQLEVAGSNVPSTRTEFTVMMVTSMGDWTVPESVREMSGPSGFGNFLLQSGFKKREQPIIQWAEPSSIPMRELKLERRAT
jgi:hypothetical protein